MNPKYRSVYLFAGFVVLAYLLFHLISTVAAFGIDGLNPAIVLLIAVPDLVVFFLAYKTYPAEGEVRRQG
jgi:hypothetical protein